MRSQSFPDEIHSQLGYYVYRLIDPRNGQTFYIGKGKGNRVFSHVAGVPDLSQFEDDASEKIQVIHQIQNAGLEPIHVVHRHGMSEDEAFLVESALIDATPGLTNLVKGQGSDSYGPANADELIARYQLSVLELLAGHKILAINIGTTFEEQPVYEAVRCAWKIDKTRAEKADFIFATRRGVCLDVFVADRWLPALTENFPRLPVDEPKRWGFEGRPAPQEILSLYKGKRLPEGMRRKKGMASPVLYYL